MWFEKIADKKLLKKISKIMFWYLNKKNINHMIPISQEASVSGRNKIYHWNILVCFFNNKLKVVFFLFAFVYFNHCKAWRSFLDYII